MELYENASNITFPEGPELIYRLVNRFDNATLLISDFLELQ